MHCWQSKRRNDTRVRPSLRYPFRPLYLSKEPVSMAKIASVSVCTARIPLDRVTAFATRTVTARDYGLVKVRSTDGVEGIGFCYAGSKAGGLVAKAVRELFAPLLIGKDPYRVEGHLETMYREAVLQGRAGAVMRALSIIDIALWDRNARAAGLPLYK